MRSILCYRKRGMQMQNLQRKYPHFIKRQDVDAIVHDKWGEKYLQVQRKVSCRCFGLNIMDPIVWTHQTDN